MTEEQRPGPDNGTFPGDERGSFGMRLFLLSLTILFAGSMVGYAVIRSRAAETVDIQLPTAFWWSTAAIIASGIALSRALASARAGQAARLRRALVFALGLSLIFLAIQAPAVWHLLSMHEAMREQNVYLYGLALALIVLHALHVLGGMIPLVTVTLKTLSDPAHYHSYHHGPVRYVAMYWHFLEAGWIVMFGLFIILG